MLGSKPEAELRSVIQMFPQQGWLTFGSEPSRAEPVLLQSPLTRVSLHIHTAHKAWCVQWKGGRTLSPHHGSDPQSSEHVTGLGLMFGSTTFIWSRWSEDVTRHNSPDVTVPQIINDQFIQMWPTCSVTSDVQMFHRHVWRHFTSVCFLLTGSVSSVSSVSFVSSVLQQQILHMFGSESVRTAVCTSGHFASVNSSAGVCRKCSDDFRLRLLPVQRVLTGDESGLKQVQTPDVMLTRATTR